MPDTTAIVTDVAISSFLELSPDAVAMVDHEGVLVAVNEPLLTLTGHTRDQLVGSAIEQLVPERLRTQHVKTRHAFTHDPTMRPMGLGRDLWLQTADGTEVAVDIALRPIPTEHGVTIAAVIRDVSAARATQTRLEQAEAELRGTLEANQDGITMLRATRDERGELIDLVVEFANHAACSMLNIPIEHLTGMSVWEAEAQAGGDLEPGFMDYRELLRTGVPVSHEADWFDPDTGELTGILEVKAALAGPDRVVAAFRNVIEQRRATAQIEEMNVALRSANVSMENAAAFQRDFISASSHELRTPLTAMTGFAELLVNRWDEINDDARQSAAQAIHRNARRQLQLVNDLAHAAHLQSGRLELALTAVDLDAALAEAISSVVGAEAFDAAPSTGVEVLADEGRLIQILINMISNALRYGVGPYGFEIGVSDDGVRLCVWDSGKGVPEEFVPFLFDAFAQASRGNRREAKGTGLGLYISHTLSLAMGGTLAYETAHTGGACFVLTLPEVSAST